MGFVAKFDYDGVNVRTEIDVDRNSVLLRQGNAYRYAEMDDLPEAVRDAMARFNHRIKLLIERKYAAFLRDLEPEIHIPRP